MSTALLIARIVLAGVFVVAGFAKLRDRSGTRQAAVEFGTPVRIAPAFAIVLPLLELATAALLVPVPSARYGAVAALALLLAFTAAVGNALAHGRTPDCNCFGQVGSRPVGARTLLRNAGLIAVAVFVVVGGWSDPGLSAVAWIGRLDAPGGIALALGLVLAAVCSAGAVLVLNLLSAHGRLLVRIETLENALVEAGLVAEPAPVVFAEGLPVGLPAPAIELATLDGDAVPLASLLVPSRPTVVLFTSPTCGPCQALMPEVAGWQRDHASELTIVVASDGDADAVREKASGNGLERVYRDVGLAAYSAFRAAGTPSAVIVGADGTVASGLAAGAGEIRLLVAEALERPDGAGTGGGVRVGAWPPKLALENLEGETVDLDTFHGKDTVFLFWNPGCGFCRGMHDDLVSWEAERSESAPQLVVVSSGDTNALAEEGFRSPVLIDSGAASSAFGAGGTPMAVLVGSEGKVRSHVLAGAPAVMALLER